MDAVSYNTLIKAYVRHNLFDQACALLLTMRPLLNSPLEKMHLIQCFILSDASGRNHSRKNGPVNPQVRILHTCQTP